MLPQVLSDGTGSPSLLHPDPRQERAFSAGGCFFPMSHLLVCSQDTVGGELGSLKMQEAFQCRKDGLLGNEGDGMSFAE